MVLVNGATEFAGDLAIIDESCRDHPRMGTRNGVLALKGQACVSKGNEGENSDDCLKELHCGAETVVCGE